MMCVYKMCVCVLKYVCVLNCVCVYLNVCVCIKICASVCVCERENVCLYTHTHTHTHTHRSGMRWWGGRLSTAGASRTCTCLFSHMSLLAPLLSTPPRFHYYYILRVLCDNSNDNFNSNDNNNSNNNNNNINNLTGA